MINRSNRSIKYNSVNDTEKMNQQEAKVYESNLQDVFMHCKIHERSKCQCRSISQFFIRNPDIDIILVKLYDDNHDEDKFSKVILLPKTINLDSIMRDKHDRSIIYEYFKNGNGNSKDVSESIQHIKTFCFCNSKLIDNPNGGSILLGREDLMIEISAYFNHYFKKTSSLLDVGEPTRRPSSTDIVELSLQSSPNTSATEFTSLVYCRLKDLHKLLNKYQCDHTINYFLTSSYYKEFTYDERLNNLFTILGVKDNKIGFSFGKREYISNSLHEDSFECSIRELFEEFRIDLSPTIRDQNRTPFHITYASARLHPIIIPNNTEIVFDQTSQTIVLKES